MTSNLRWLWSRFFDRAPVGERAPSTRAATTHRAEGPTRARADDAVVEPRAPTWLLWGADVRHDHEIGEP